MQTLYILLTRTSLIAQSAVNRPEEGSRRFACHPLGAFFLILFTEVQERCFQVFLQFYGALDVGLVL